MKNRIAYYLYYAKYHKRKCIALICNLILLISAIVDATINIKGLDFFDRLGIRWGSVGVVVLLALSIVWSLYDDFIANAVDIWREDLAVYSSDLLIQYIECDVTEGEVSEAVGSERAFYRPEINDMLIREDRLIIDDDYDVPKNVSNFIKTNADFLFKFLHTQYKDSQDRKKMFFNEKKLCLTSDLEVDTSATDYIVNVHKGCYYDTFLTNICCTKKLVTQVDNRTIYDGQAFYPQSSLRLNPLNESQMNNEIGISTIAFTKDYIIIIWESNNKAQIDQYLLVPSGSGSADWKDQKGKRKFKDVIAYSMERELKEECSLVKKKIKTETRVIGYWRWLNKGGKPEFCGVTKLDCPKSKISANRQEVARWHKGGHFHLNEHERNADGIIKFIDGMLRQKGNEDEGMKLSLPLYMNLLFLRQYILTEDLGHLDVEEQNRRVAFLLGE